MSAVDVSIIGYRVSFRIASVLAGHWVWLMATARDASFDVQPAECAPNAQYITMRAQCRLPAPRRAHAIYFECERLRAISGIVTPQMRSPSTY